MDEVNCIYLMDATIPVNSKNSQQFYIQTSESLKKFIQSVTVRNKITAIQYNSRLLIFERCLKKTIKLTWIFSYKK